MGCAGAILALGAPYFPVNARSLENALTSASGQKRTFRGVNAMSALPPEADISDGRFLSEIWVWHAFACDPSKQLHRFQRQNRFNRIDERSAAFAKFAFIAFPSGESDLRCVANHD